MPGTLFLVATPIGNLEDITYRAVRILREASLIACEDTRQTRKLLAHFGIDKKLTSYHEHNERPRAAELVDLLLQGTDVALVSDAGTPLISDPGYQIVSLAAEKGIQVTPIPGPSAAIAALAASGLPSDVFSFLGFVPQKGKRRRQALALIASLDHTVVLYESPHRILLTLDDLAQACPGRQIVAAREMTKIHEEFLRGTAESIRESLANRPAVKGEFTLVISKPDAGPEAPAGEAQIRTAVSELVAAGTPRMDAIKTVARQMGVPKRIVYQACEQPPES